MTNDNGDNACKRCNEISDKLLIFIVSMFSLNAIQSNASTSFINVLDFLSTESNHLYERITEKLIITLRMHFGRPRRGDKYLV